MADGIKIKINCDIRGAEKAMKQLESQVARLEKAERKAGHIDTNFKKLGAEAQAAYAEAEKALEKYVDAEKKASSRRGFIKQRVLSKNPVAKDVDIKSAEDQDSTLYGLSAAAEAAMHQYEALTAKAENLAQKHERLGQTLQQAKAELAAERGATQQLQQEINNTDFVVERIKGAFKELGSSIAAGIRSGVAAAGGALASLPGKALGVAKSLTGSLKKIPTAFAKIGKSAASAAARMAGFRRESKKGQSAAAGFSKAIIKLGTMLKLMVIRTALRSVIKAAKEGFQNLAQYSTSANKNMSALMSSLTQLKNSFATAFGPILTAVTPALTQLIGLLSKAATNIGMVIASLSGAKTFTKAAKVTEDYAESLEDANKQGKTFSFDTLNQMQGGGNAGKATPSEMFEEVDIPNWIQDLTDMFKDQDWTGLGTWAAEAFNKGFSALKDLISWDRVGGAMSNVVAGFTGTLNSMVNGIRWDTMGQALSAGVNTLVNTLAQILRSINWYALGAGLSAGLLTMILTINWPNLGALFAARFNAVLSFIMGALSAFNWAEAAESLTGGLNSFVSEVNWAGIGQTLSTFCLGALAFLYTAVTTFDWVALGENVRTMLVNIDWGGIFTSMFQTMGAVFGGLIGFLWGLLKDAWGGMVQWWNAHAIEDGKFTIAGLLSGILEAIAGIGTWIKEHIFQPFINGFKAVFGIHSPSTVMEEMGGYLIAGLKNGLLGLWDNIKGIFTGAVENIKSVFSMDNLKSIGANAVTGLTNGLKTVGNKVAEWGSGLLGGIKNALGIHSPSTETEEVGEYTVAGFINGLQAYAGKLNTAINNMTASVLSVFRKLSTDLLDNQDSTQRSATTQLGNWMNTVLAMFSSFYASMKSQTNNWAADLRSTLSSMVSAAQSAASSIASALASARSNAASLSSLNTSSSTQNAAKAASYTVKAPAYASGAVLPANHPHLAIVGDQRHGTNIETQLDTMKAAFREAMSEMGGGGTGNSRPVEINLYLDTGVRLGRALLPSIEEASGSYGVSMTAKRG